MQTITFTQIQQIKTYINHHKAETPYLHISLYGSFERSNELYCANLEHYMRRSHSVLLIHIQGL